MKLLICLDCNDVFNLDYEEKHCKCGKSKGKYLDQLNAIYQGENVLPLGFDNYSLVDAINNQPEDGLGERFTAFVIPQECETFKKKDVKDVDEGVSCKIILRRKSKRISRAKERVEYLKEDIKGINKENSSEMKGYLLNQVEDIINHLQNDDFSENKYNYDNKNG